MSDYKKAHLLKAATDLAKLKDYWNRVNIPELTFQAHGTPYDHVALALWEVLRNLGGFSQEEAYDFYDLVSQGMTGEEALGILEASRADR